MLLVISDAHIGDYHANRNLPRLFSILKKYANSNCTLVLNGDTFDFAKLLEFDERHRLFFSIIAGYGKVICLEGNHDWFLSGLQDVLPGVSFRKELILNLQDNIVHIHHGHQADRFISKWPRFTRCLIRVNHWFEKLTGVDLQHWFWKTWLVQRFLLRRQERRLIRAERVANIVIAGHTHQPCVRREGSVMYYNTGDWVEKNHGAYLMIDDNEDMHFVMPEGGDGQGNYQ
jgi:UDP-2,3-diacylglucosamine pyrophosphatase LpxH